MILDPQKSYTFSNYFEMRIDALDLAEYFGYSFKRAPLDLPRYAGELDRCIPLKEDLVSIIPRLIRLNEQSKREAIIFPILKTALLYADAAVRIEQPIKVSEQLQGVLDYLLTVDNLKQLVVIEAKQGDLDYGFSQLLAEMIALDRWERSPSLEQQPILIGAVTIGELWRFGTLNRLTQAIVEDTIGYQAPSDLEPLLRILVQSLLQSNPQP